MHKQSASSKISRIFVAMGTVILGFIAFSFTLQAEARPNRFTIGKQVSQTRFHVVLRRRTANARVTRRGRFHMTLSCRKDGYRPMGIGKKGFGSIRAKNHPVKKGIFHATLTGQAKIKKFGRKWCRLYWNKNHKRNKRLKNTCREVFGVYQTTGVCIKVKGTMFGSLINKCKAKTRAKVRICCVFSKMPKK